MLRLISSPLTPHQPFSLLRFSASLFFALLLNLSLFFGLCVRVPIAAGSSFTHGYETLDRHHTPGLAPFPTQQTSFARTRWVKAIPPALTITIKNLPATMTDGQQSIAYQLLVNNARSAGPVVAGNTILISNNIPSGLVNVTVRARKLDWKVTLTATTSPTQLTAMYIGRYPVGAGITLSPIIVRGILESFINPAKNPSKTFWHLFSTATVKWSSSSSQRKIHYPLCMNGHRAEACKRETPGLAATSPSSILTSETSYLMMGLKPQS